MERIKTECRVTGTGGEIEQRILTLSGVVIVITAIRWWINRSQGRSSENEYADETDESYLVNTYDWFLDLVLSATAGLEERRSPRTSLRARARRFLLDMK